MSSRTERRLPGRRMWPGGAVSLSRPTYVGLCRTVARAGDVRALRLLRTAGLLVTRKQGRVVFNRLADDFPAPLRDHCLRQLIALTHTTDTDS